MKTKISRSLLAFLATLALTNCGGGGNSGISTAPPTPPPAQTPPPAPQFSVTTTSLPLGLVGSPYSAQITSANGTPPITWTAQSFTLPSGFTVSADGLVSGTPSSVRCGSNTAIQVTATDSSTPPKTATASLPYNFAGINVFLSPGQVGVSYYEAIQFDCATEPVSWSLTSGVVPPGLSMFPQPGDTMQLSFQGTPTQGGAFPVAVHAQDASGRSAQASGSINILPPVLKIADGLMELGVVNQHFDHVVPASGGTPPYSFSLATGALAPGLQLNAANGDISGTPTTAGYYQFNVKVTDATASAPFTLEKPYSMLVTPAALPARNDSTANATPIYPGTYVASLSPYTDAVGNAAPDQDYYVVTGNGGAVYVVQANNEYLSWASSTNPAPVNTSVDPAIEILDGSGTRMSTCNDPLADNPPTGAPFAKGAGDFTDACVNHNGGPAQLTVQLPPGTSQTFYIHVFDFQGRARPDFIYSLALAKQ